MKLKNERFIHGKHDTIGKMFSNGVFSCNILEDEKRAVKVYGETRIPDGTYEIRLRTFGRLHEKYLKRFGPDFHKGMLWLQNVPNFDGILIHCGVTDKDTLGCLLTGSNYVSVGDRHQLIESEKAYRKFYPPVAAALLSGEKVLIEIVSI